MAYRIYRSDDPGAIAAGLPILPRATNTNTSSHAPLVTILDAVLVNGYAGKPPAGWTKPFATDGTKHIYLSGSATGAALRIDGGLGHGCSGVSVMANPTSLTTTAIIGTNAIRGGNKSGGGVGHFCRRQIIYDLFSGRFGVVIDGWDMEPPLLR